MGQLLAGPFCGQLLADFGAEVIKVEPPAKGDPMRVWGRGKVEDGQGLWWPVVARNKKSVEVNLREAEGQQIIRDLVAKSDILIENFRAGTMEKWGLGYDELAAINPRLIMIRVSGYGQTGPYSQKAGYAAIGEAMGGLRSCRWRSVQSAFAHRHFAGRHAGGHLWLYRRPDGAARARTDRARPDRR